MKKWLIVLSSIFFTHQLFAQSVSVEATVSSNKVGLSDRFKYTITINNSADAKDFRPPSLSDFIVLGGPNQSMSYQNINGKTSQQIAYSYVLQPKKLGTFTISAAYVKVSGQTYSTKPISIEVIDKPASTGNTPNQSNQKSQDPQSSSDGDIESYVKENVFIKTEVSDMEVYKGENIAVTLKMYVADKGDIIGPRGFQNIITPKYDGFYAEEIDLPDQQLKTETINGVRYQVSTIKKTVLTPQRSGTLEVDPLSIDAIFAVLLRNQSRNFNPFATNAKQVLVNIKSNTVKIKVNELPPNTPADFNGAVGKFTMKTQINATETKTDEPLTYRIAITGTGNLELFSAPELNLPPGWETYEPKITTASGTKTFEYLLIPRSPGDFTIPSYTWSYLEPTSNKYVSLASEAYNVKVEAGPGYNPSTGNYATKKEELEALANDIRFINKHNPTYYSARPNFAGSFGFYCLFLLPVVAGAGLYVYTWNEKRKNSDVVGLRINNANANAKKRLTKAETYVTANNSRDFFDETIKALWGYLSDKLVINKSELSKENVEQVLSKRNVSATTAASLISLLNDCEMSLYAPSVSSGSLQQVYTQAVELITKLENEIK